MSQAVLRPAAPAGALSLARVLTFDAITGVVMGVALLALAQPLAAWLGLPQALLWWAGLVLLPCTVVMVLAARRSSRALATLVIAGNVGWVLASLAVALLLEPTALGLAFVLGQAAAVVVLAALEWSGLRAGHFG
jgi:hypothetical protein